MPRRSRWATVVGVEDDGALAALLLELSRLAPEVRGEGCAAARELADLWGASGVVLAALEEICPEE